MEEWHPTKKEPKPAVPAISFQDPYGPYSDTYDDVSSEKELGGAFETKRKLLDSDYPKAKGAILLDELLTTCGQSDSPPPEAHSDDDDELDVPFKTKIKLLLDSYQAGLDIEKYNQLRFRPSRVIAGFRNHPSCCLCFIEEHNLDRTVVKNLYTGESLFKGINIALCNEENSLAELAMLTQLLCEALYIIHESLPAVVYRGVKFSTALGKLYAQHIGKTIYWYNFVSTSRQEEQAKKFIGSEGWMIEITLWRGNRDCVADVSSVSAYAHEQEILISCNSGFKIIDVSLADRRIYLELTDQSKCLYEKPVKRCEKHQ